MGGGVSPIEWVFPVVGASHAAYNAAAQQVSPRAKLDAPSSKNDIANDKLADARIQSEEARQAEGARQALVPRPQTPEQEQESRQRAIAASELLGGRRRRRVSQTLTGDEALLSGLPREVQ